MSKEQRNLRAGDSSETTDAAKPRRDIANEAAAHALRLLEKVRHASEARLAKTDTDGDGQQNAAPHAVVIGGGIAGLVAARELRQTGHEVTVLEATGNFGGCVRSTEVAGLRIDAGAESFAVRGGSRRLLPRRAGSRRADRRHLRAACLAHPGRGPRDPGPSDAGHRDAGHPG